MISFAILIRLLWGVALKANEAIEANEAAMKYTPRDYAKILYEKPDAEGFLRLLEAHSVVSWLPRIMKRFHALRKKREGIVDVTITSARPLSSVQREKVSDLAIYALEGKNVAADFSLNPSLIGGFRIESDEILVRGSVRDTLEKLLNE